MTVAAAIPFDGGGALGIEGETVPLQKGQALFVPAVASHRFVGYVGLRVLVIFAKDR